MSKLLVLTQPWPRVERLADQLWQAGVPNLAIAFSRIEPVWEEPLMLQSHDWVVVVSPSAAERLLALAQPFDPEVPMPRFACVGPGTVLALREGLQALAWPDPEIHWPDDSHDAQTLLAAPFWGRLKDRSVLVARAERSKTAWAAAFRERQAMVTDLALYRQVPVAPDWAFALPRLLRLMGEPGFTRLAWYVSQESVAERLVQEVRNLSIGHVTQRDLALVPHERIRKHLERLGWAHAQVILPGAAGLISALQTQAAA